LHGGLRQHLIGIYSKGLEKYYNCFIPLSTPNFDFDQMQLDHEKYWDETFARLDEDVSKNRDITDNKVEEVYSLSNRTQEKGIALLFWFERTVKSLQTEILDRDRHLLIQGD
jgi:benzoyl-CoA reductase/2-hydroxyglutaryl-CoA dehydratase subunit BcrC/BadD/HgdB